MPCRYFFIRVGAIRSLFIYLYLWLIQIDIQDWVVGLQLMFGDCFWCLIYVCVCVCENYHYKLFFSYKYIYLIIIIFIVPFYCSMQLYYVEELLFITFFILYLLYTKSYNIPINILSTRRLLAIGILDLLGGFQC